MKTAYNHSLCSNVEVHPTGPCASGEVVPILVNAPGRVLTRHKGRVFVAVECYGRMWYGWTDPDYLVDNDVDTMPA
jgi:hypothetical protein